MKRLAFAVNSFQGAFTVTIGISLFSGYHIWEFQQWQQNRSMEKKLVKIQKLFESREPMESAEDAKGICGRFKVMRSNDPDSFYTLANKHKPYAFVVGNCGLYNLSQCKTDYQKMIALGFEQKYIKHQLNAGFTFNLYLFPEKENNYQCLPATWDGIFELLSLTEPEIYNKINKYEKDLKTKTYEEIQLMSDFDFLTVHCLGKQDDRYMTKEKFLIMNENEITIADARFLLYNFMGLSKLFRGDGYTIDKNGKTGPKEYLIKNMALTNIDKLKEVTLTVL